MYYGYGVAGRWGYNNQYPGRGEWLVAIPNKFDGKANTITIQEISEIVKNLEPKEAYSFIFNCGLPTPKMNMILKYCF